MQYGLIGERLGHSFSREVHARLGDYPYELCELPPDGVEAFMRARDFLAINVTIPYKETVMPYLDGIDEAARAIGAVNTVRRVGDRLFGYNTDFAGLSDLVRRTGVDLCGLSVLILGSGGTSKTARAVAHALGAREVTVVSRQAGEGSVSYEDAYARYAHAEFLINATPVGMYPKQEASPIDLSRFPHLCGVVDAIYNPLRTDLVLDARARGIPAEGGLYMLVAQGVMASRIFKGEVEAAFADEISMDGISEKIYKKILSDKQNIVLTGMPGSGKSTVGRALAELLGRPFVDTDALIEERAGKAISDIFAEVWEAGFRDLESQVVAHAANNVTGHIIATGGGAILRDDNVRALRRTGRLYFLNRSVEMLIPTSDRPLATTRQAILKRFEERYDRYLATADVEVKIDEVMSHTIQTVREDFFS